MIQLYQNNIFALACVASYDALNHTLWEHFSQIGCKNVLTCGGGCDRLTWTLTWGPAVKLAGVHVVMAGLFIAEIM